MADPEISQTNSTSLQQPSRSSYDSSSSYDPEGSTGGSSCEEQLLELAVHVISRELSIGDISAAETRCIGRTTGGEVPEVGCNRAAVMLSTIAEAAVNIAPRKFLHGTKLDPATRHQL